MKSSSRLLTNSRELGSLLAGLFSVIKGGRVPCVCYEDENLETRIEKGIPNKTK